MSTATAKTIVRQVRRDAATALHLPDRLTPSAWAAKHRVLSAAETSEPGPYQGSRTPYAAGFMDAILDPNVQELTLVSGTQLGKSEATRNILGYWIEEDPGPCLIVFPSEAAVIEILKERIRPLLLNTPALRRHLRDERDIQQSGVMLDTMPIFFGWAGSPQSLATRPCRYVIFDECDKYPSFAGREADPISLGTERTITYGHRRRIIKISTPTNREGPIWRAWEASGDRRRFQVPCPHCGEFQILDFQGTRWPKIEGSKQAAADAIEQGRLAWYECAKCREKIADWQKPRMLAAGRWVSEGGKSSRVGFHLSGLASPWRRWCDIAGQWLRADGDPGATMNFRNAVLAEPFEDVVTKSEAGTIRQKANTAPPPGIIPRWTQALFATADTQKDWFKVHVRAWGWGYRSQLILETVCQTFDEVYRIALGSDYQVEGGGIARPHHLLIDSGGDRTDQVYQFALRDPGRILPCKGASHTMRRPFTITQLPSGVSLRMIDTEFYKDMLSRLIADPDATKWLPHRDVTDQYSLEMSSEHKVIDRHTGRLTWVKKSSGARNEAWDCETLQCAAADMANMGAVPAEPTPATPPPEPQPQRRSGWLDSMPTWR